MKEWMGGKERRQRGTITYLASWFIIDVLGCPQRGSHGFLGRVPELDFQVLSIGQAPKREETVHSPHHYSKFQEEFCKEGTDPYTPDTAEDRDPETVSSSSGTDLLLPQPRFFLSLDCSQPSPPWCHLPPYLAQRMPLFLFQLEHSPYSD